MRAAASALLGFALLLAAGCGEERDPTEADKGGWRIAAGTYGNVVPDTGNGGMRGMEVVLDRGDASASADFVRCQGTCEASGKRALRRGLNGVSFAIDHGGRTIDVLVGPAGPDAVEISADWGQGIESHRLPKIARAVGQPAVDDAAAPIAPAPPAPLVTSSPPPLPSPTP